MSNQEHVCIAITKSNMGGAQKYVLTLATQLKSRGLRVTVLAGGDGELFGKLDAVGIEYVRLGNSQRDVSFIKEFRLMQELYGTIKKIQPDILHLNSSKLGVIGTVIGKVAGIKRIIFTAHGWAFNEKRPAWQKCMLYFLYWITILLCDMTLCVSRKTREQILSLPFMQNKTTVVYNGISVPDFYTKDNARAQLAAQFPFLDLNKKWIAVLAELHPIKGHDILIQAVSKIKDNLENYQIVCLGSGQDEQKLKSLVSQNTLDSYVYFTGFVDNASLYLKAFEANILPSRSEAMPLAVLETGVAGTLMIASDVGGIPEIITDGETGLLFHTENSDELAQKIKTALNLDEQARTKITDALAQKIASSFSIEQMVDKTIAAYKRN